MRARLEGASVTVDEPGVSIRSYRRRTFEILGSSRPEDLEGLIRAAADREVGAFEQPRARVEQRLGRVAHVGRGVDPEQPGLVPPHGAPPPLEGHDVERALDPAELAAYAAVGSMILNLDEAISKN